MPFCAKCYVRIVDGIRFRGRCLAKNFRRAAAFGIQPELQTLRYERNSLRRGRDLPRQLLEAFISRCALKISWRELHKGKPCSKVVKAIHAVGNRVASKPKNRKSMLKTKTQWFGLVCGAALFISSAAGNAADAKSYQVTGPVLELTPTVITVQKGNDKWEIQRNSNTKVTGDLKVGAKVTIYYTMVAGEVEVKGGKSGKAAKSESK
jgi:hypothetical protein